MAKSETLNLRISAEFKRKLVEEAAKQKRSVTNYLEVTLTALWERDLLTAQRPRKRTARH